MPSTQDAAQDLLHRDDLTGLYNRRFFNTLYPELTARAAAEGQPLAMLLVDLDYFKSINDTYGHRQGDHVIAHLGGLLHRAVGNDGYAIRYAGDEFALLIPGLAKALAVEVGHRLAEAARSTPLELLDGAGTLQITLSVGVAAMPDDTREPEELFDRADLACAAAKKAGRNQAMGYSEEHTQVVDKLTLYKHFPCPRLVARDELLTRLGQHLFPAYEQRLPMVMLQGPGGVGKSRLLRDLRERADPQRLRVMAAGGLPYLMSQPFGYLSEALGNLIRQDPAAGSHMATSLSPQQVTTVSRLLPELSRHVLLSPQAGELPPDEIPAAFAQMLLALAQDRRLLLLLDDFQWCDPGTLAALTLLCDNAQARSISILLALRAEALEEVSDQEACQREAVLRDFIARMVRSNHLASFPVPPLSRPQVDEMVAAIVPPLAQNQKLLDLVWQKSGGLPLMVEEILRYLITCEAIRPSADGKSLEFQPPAEAIPTQPQTLVRLQADQMHVEMRGALARMAVAGKKFDFQTLQEMEGINAGYLRHILDQAKKESLIIETWENDIEVFEFASDEARETLAELLNPRERKMLHARLADYKEKRYAGSLDAALADLAYHYSQAGETEKAERYLGIIQGLYQGFSAPSELILVGRPADLKGLTHDRPLTEAELEAGLEVCRLLKVALGATRMYGPEADHVKAKYKDLLHALRRLTEKFPSFDLSEAGGTLLICGTPASKAPELGEMLSGFQVKSLSFKKGLSPDEISALIEALLLKKEELAARGGLGKVLKEAGVVHIVPNERIFVHVAEQDVLLKKKDSQETVLLKDLESLRKMVGLDEVDFEVDAETAEIMRARGGAPSAAAMEKHLSEILSERVAAARQGPDYAPAPGTSFSAADLEELQRLQTEIRSWYQELSKYIDLSFMEAVSSDWKVLCRDLESGNRIKISAACKAFIDRAPESIEPLVSFVALTEDPRARKIAIHLLKKLTPEAPRLLVEKLFSTSSSEEKFRLIAATEDIPEEQGLAGRLESCVYHPDARVRRVAIEAIARLNRASLERALLEALKSKENPEIRHDAAEALGNYGFYSARRQLIGLCRRRSIFFPEENPRVQEAALVALGKMADAEVVKVLTGALERTGLFWRTKPSQVRAAAALALGQAAEAAEMEIRRLLDRLTRDPDPAVRSACKVALEHIRQGRRTEQDVKGEKEFFAKEEAPAEPEES